MSKANKILFIQMAIGILVVATQVLTMKFAPIAMKEPVYGLLILGFGIFSAFIMIKWWENLDEASRESHKWAMLWGSNIAVLTTIFGISINYFTHGVFVQTIIKLSNFQDRQFALGMVLCAILMALGYGLAWGYWWVKRR